MNHQKSITVIFFPLRPSSVNAFDYQTFPRVIKWCRLKERRQNTNKIRFCETTKTSIAVLLKKTKQNNKKAWRRGAFPFYDFNAKTKRHVAAVLFYFCWSPHVPTEPSFTGLLIKSCPALWPYFPTSHAFSGGIWSEIRQESTETSLTLLLLHAATTGTGTGCGTLFFPFFSFFSFLRLETADGRKISE